MASDHTREPQYERALFYRGMLLKRSGRSDRAIRDFKLAAELNPKNIDAVREVRLYAMRHRGKTGAPPSSPRKGQSVAPKDGGGGGGLFGKFFKK